MIDADPQGDLTTSLGWKDNDNLKITISEMLVKVIQDEPIQLKEGILHHSEGVDLMPANIDLCSMEMGLVNAMSRERVLSNYLKTVKEDYDYILLDCPPSLGLITVNALTASDSVVIPVQAHYLPAKGMSQLLKTITKVKRYTNPDLKVEGILMTLVDKRTNLSKEAYDVIREEYGSVIKVYNTQIPIAVKAAEVSKKGMSIYAYDPKGTVAEAYQLFTREVLKDAEKKRDKLRTAIDR